MISAVSVIPGIDHWVAPSREVASVRNPMSHRHHETLQPAARAGAGLTSPVTALRSVPAFGLNRTPLGWATYDGVSVSQGHSSRWNPAVPGTSRGAFGPGSAVRVTPVPLTLDQIRSPPL